MPLRLIPLLILVLLASACGTPPPAQTGGEGSVPLPAASGSAVRSLLRKARAAAQAQQPEQAAALLERALRIEPDNAVLWNYLAKLRLRQGQLQQAIDLAARSTSMTSDPLLQSDNWRIIAHAYYQQGNMAAARKAQARAKAARDSRD